MSLESRYEALKAEFEAWWTKHVYHPEVGSIAQAHLLNAKSELDQAISNFTSPDVFHVEPSLAPESFLPPNAD